MVEMGNLFKAETELIDKIRELMIEMQPKLRNGLKLIIQVPFTRHTIFTNQFENPSK